MDKVAFRVEFYHHFEDKKKSCWVVYNYSTYEMVAGGFATK